MSTETCRYSSTCLSAVYALEARFCILNKCLFEAESLVEYAGEASQVQLCIGFWYPSTEVGALRVHGEGGLWGPCSVGP